MVSNLVWSLFGVAYNWPLGAAVSVVIVALTRVLLWLMARLERRLGDGGGPAERARSGVVRA